MLRAMRLCAACRAPLVRPTALAVGFLLAASAALAAPDASDDAVNRFLLEKGLVTAAVTAPTESDFVRQVRDKASEMVLTAMNFLGVPYRRGGNNSEDGFDCSGFTRHVFEMSLGLVLPRRADEQARAPGMFQVKRDELKPGDLVFFNTLKRTFSHVGIYVGDGKFIHAPRTGSEVRVEDMRLAYWTKRYNGARRAAPMSDGPSAGTPSDEAPPGAAKPPAAKVAAPSSRPR
jgi:cell wall-associated NlpC family hydrolase